MTGKKLNTTAVLNELKGQSAFFNPPASSTPSTNTKKSPTRKTPTPTPKRTVGRTDEPSNERPHERSNGKNNPRPKIRHTFDIFEDQLRSLHTLQLKTLQAGEKKPALGELVQRALDDYLKKQTRTKDRTSGRTDEPPDERTNEQI